MKKILLSCACCLLALGLVTACDNEEEEPNEPEVPGTVVDDGGDRVITTVKTGVLGLYQENLGEHLYFTGELNTSNFGIGTSVYSKASAVTLGEDGTNYYLSVVVDGATKYIGCTDTSKSAMSLVDEPYALVYDSTYDAYLTTDGKEFLCTYGTYTTFSWSNASTYLGKEGEFVAHLYEKEQTNPVSEGVVNPVPEWEVDQTYFFGISTNLVTKYIDGTTVGTYSYEGTLVTNPTYVVPVTVGSYTVSGVDDVAEKTGTDSSDDDEDEDLGEGEEGLPAYTLSFELGEETYYITIVSGEHTDLSYSTEKAPIYWNAELGAWVNEDNTYFLCYNSTYDCLYASAIDDSSYGPDGILPSPIAALYPVIELTAPTTMEISGPSAVYVGYEAELSHTVNEGASLSVTWDIALPEDGTNTLSSSEDASSYASIDQNGVVTGIAACEKLVVTAKSTLEGGVSATHEISVVELETPNIGVDTTYKLGSKDEASYTYRYFNGQATTTGSGANINYFLGTTTNYEEGADVYITGLSSDGIENSCTLSFVDSTSGSSLKYIAWSTSTQVIISDNPFVWIWDDTNNFFYTLESGTGTNARFLAQYTSGSYATGNDTASFRAYTQSTTYLAYPHVTAYSSEPEAMENPNAGLTATAVTSLTSGSQYYVGCVADEELGTYYLFDGGNYSDQQLTGTQVLEDAVLVTATGDYTNGWTFTFTLEVEGVETEYTLYSYLSTINGSTYCEISAVASSSLEEKLATEELVALSTFEWDSTYHGITVTLSNTKYFLNQNTGTYAYEFRMSNYNSDASNSTWISFYSSVTKAPEQ